MSTSNLRLCVKGHKYYKTSDCPVCPICEKVRQPSADFLKHIGAPARRALESKGIDTLFKLSKLSEQDLLKLHGLGPGSIPKLRKALKEKGYSFKKSK